MSPSTNDKPAIGDSSSGVLRKPDSWIKQDWRIILFGFVLMYCSSPGQTYFIALFGGEIRADLNLSHGEFGAVYSAATLCSAFLLLWSGRILDRAVLNYFVFGVVAGLATASFVMSFATGALSLFLAIFLLRHFGQGLMGMTSVTTMMRYVPAHKAKASALSHMGYSAAEATIPSVIVACLLFTVWQDIWRWLALGLILVLPLLLSYLLQSHKAAKKRAADGHAKQSSNADHVVENAYLEGPQWSRAQVVKDPFFYAILPGLTCQSLLYTGYMFHQVHLVESKGWSLAVWAGLYLVFSLTTLSMSFVLGALVDRFGALRVIPWINVPMMFGLLVLASSSSILTAVVFMVCMALSTAGQASSGGPFYSERYGNKNLGAIKSLGSFYMVLMTAVSPIILGYFIDQSVSMNVLALGGVVYALIVSVVAGFACKAALLSPKPKPNVPV